MTTGFPFFFFSFLCEYYPGCGLLKNWILFSRLWKKKCMKFWFCLKPLSCGFCIGEGECLNRTLLTVKSRIFCTRWDPRRTLPNVFLSDVEAIWWSILSLCLYALIFLLHACVCVNACVRVCLRACDSVSTSQFNLLKIYVHPALPPLAPPQALNVSTAITFVSVLTSSKRGRAIS